MAKRRQYFVDTKVQGGLLLRAASYWLFCLLSVSLMVLCWHVLTGPPAPAAVLLGSLLKAYGIALAASLLLLPVVLVDCSRYSNRFVGPLLRFRRVLRQLADGEDVAPICFRDKDYWTDLADSFNDLRTRLQQQSPSAEATPGDLPQEPVHVEAGEEECEPAGAC